MVKTTCISIFILVNVLLNNSFLYSQEDTTYCDSTDYCCNKYFSIVDFSKKIYEYEDYQYCELDYNDLITNCFSVFILDPQLESLNSSLSELEGENVKNIELISTKRRKKTIKRIPQSLKLFKSSLVDLDLTIEKVNQIEDDFFLGFNCLKSLGLLTSVKRIPSSIFELKELEKLTLGTYNKFHKVNFELSENNNSNIKYLYITNNISKKSVRSILKLKSLKKLQIFIIDKKLPNYLKELGSLDYIEIVYNGLTVSDKIVSKVRRLLPNAEYKDLSIDSIQTKYNWR